MIRALLCAATLILPVGLMAQHQGHTPYAGFEGRQIKSLSDADLEALRAGSGWGLALAAELNGAPGPAHLLELRAEIGLSAAQVDEIQKIFDTMQAEAKEAGARFIAAERALDSAFARGGLDAATLRDLVDAAASARSDLRFVHLSRHLQTLPLLTADQIALYGALRGYGPAGPCASIPAGHDPVKWKRHNGCTD